jgi:hypothetical protein
MLLLVTYKLNKNKIKEETMTRKAVKKTKNSRENVKVRKSIKKTKSFNPAYLFIPLLVVVVLGSFFTLTQINNRAYAFSNSNSCKNVSSYTNKTVNNFIVANRSGKIDSITVLMECGTTGLSSYVNKYDLTTKNKIITDVQFVYEPGIPPFPTGTTTCKLTFVNSKLAEVYCAAFIPDGLKASHFNIFKT